MSSHAKPDQKEHDYESVQLNHDYKVQLTCWHLHLVDYDQKHCWDGNVNIHISVATREMWLIQWHNAITTRSELTFICKYLNVKNIISDCDCRDLGLWNTFWWIWPLWTDNHQIIKYKWLDCEILLFFCLFIVVKISIISWNNFFII